MPENLSEEQQPTEPAQQSANREKALRMDAQLSSIQRVPVTLTCECGEAIGPTETVVLGRFKDWCLKCVPPDVKLDPSQPCEGCGRPVVAMRGYLDEDMMRGFMRFVRTGALGLCEKRVFCSAACHASFYRRLRRERRVYICPPPCESRYRPSRKDQRYCSTACKQRAYRVRQADKREVAQ